MNNARKTRSERGPFRASGLEPDGYYELSNGHPIELAPAGHRHGSANVTGALPLATDPAVLDLGADVGHVLSDDTVRAPDLSVTTGATSEKGFAQGAPPLAVEYADEGTKEHDLQTKIQQFFAAGTRFVWVVRLKGLRRVEVYEPGAAGKKKTVSGSELLDAPGVLANPLPAAALYDRAVAMDVSLRNLLARAGYRDLDEVRAAGRELGREEGREEGREAGRELGREEGALAQARRVLLRQAKQRGITLSEAGLAQISACSDLERLDAWIDGVLTANDEQTLLRA